MRKMTDQEMIIANGGGYKCRFGDFQSEDFWPTYWHCFWTHSLPIVALIVSLL